MPVDTTKFDRVRVGGSGFTVFAFQGQALAFCRQVAHTSPQPVGAGPTPIQPMDSRYPLQIITPAAAGMGSLTLDMYELYGQQVWERLGAGKGTATGGSTVGTIFNGAIDIVDVFIKQAASATPIQVVKYIKPPTLRGANLRTYTEEYHNVVITNIVDGEQIEVGTMEVLKQITLAYTHMTRGGRTSTPTNNPLLIRDSTTTLFS